jgi:hypothetical protein
MPSFHPVINFNFQSLLKAKPVKDVLRAYTNRLEVQVLISNFLYNLNSGAPTLAETLKVRKG